MKTPTPSAIEITGIPAGQPAQEHWRGQTPDARLQDPEPLDLVSLPSRLPDAKARLKAILDQVMASPVGQHSDGRALGILVHGLISLAVGAAGWVAATHPKIKPPANFHELSDSTGQAGLPQPMQQR
jgi:hypothetical protein